MSVRRRIRVAVLALSVISLVVSLLVLGHLELVVKPKIRTLDERTLKQQQRVKRIEPQIFYIPIEEWDEWKAKNW